VLIVRSSGETLDAEPAIARAAGLLAEAGAGPGNAVAVAVADPCGFVIAALAAFKLQAPVVPIDTRAGAAWIAEAARRSHARILIEDALADGTLRMKRLEATPLDKSAGLVLFTSGSSGAPKAVLLSRAGIEANVDAILTYLPIRAHPRTAVTLPLSYSYALVGQVLTTQRAGGTLLLLGDIAFPPVQLEAMVRLEASGLSSVPTSLRLLARAIAEGAPRPKLGYVASAGAALGSAQALRGAFPGARLFNQYGLTEASPRVSAISDAEPQFDKGSVGRPLPGIESHVDPEGNLFVRGPSVMLGYLDDPQATARVLSPDGTLRTGDMAHIDADGYLYIEGRTDGVVKCGGERIGVDEIAVALRDCPGVRDAAVVAIPDELLGAKLAAYVEVAENALPSVRKALRDKLAPAKRPWRISALDALPRLASGKPDLQKLKSMAEQS
jgi:long-chain acyl-CoA synthetase